MHVLYLHQHFTTREGSFSTRSYEFAQALLRRGHKVTMVCGSHALSRTGLHGDYAKGLRRGMVDGIEVIEMHLPYSNYDGFLKRSLTFLRFALRALGMAFFESYDLLFATSTPLTVAIPGIVMKRFRRKPFVFEVRDLWPELPRAMGVITNPLALGLMNALEWAAYHSADACIALSPGIKAGIEKKTSGAKSVAMIPNGSDLDYIPDKQRDKSLFPQSISQKDFIAVFAGAHGIANGLSSLLDAAEVLAKLKAQDIKILLIGDGKEKAALKQRAAAQKLTNIAFLDPLPKTQLFTVLAACDAGLMILKNVPAFYYGTSPNKFFDYLACGLPVINNYPGWLADMITEHKCGIAVPPDNPQALAQALLELAEKRELAREMGRRAFTLARTHFDRAVLADKFCAFLEHVFLTQATSLRA